MAGYQVLTDQDKADIVARLKREIVTLEQSIKAREAADYEARLRATIGMKVSPDTYEVVADASLPRTSDVAAVLDVAAQALPAPSADPEVIPNG